MNAILKPNGAPRVDGPSIPDDGPERFEWSGTEYAIHLRAADSDGALGVFEGLVPLGDGPPIHVHTDADEALHVLEGRYEFWLDGERSSGGPGTTVFVPRGVPHAFRVIGDRAGRNLAIVTPGGFEGFFVEAVAARLEIPRDLAAIGALAERFGMEFTGPPLSAM